MSEPKFQIGQRVKLIGSNELGVIVKYTVNVPLLYVVKLKTQYSDDENEVFVFSSSDLKAV